VPTTTPPHANNNYQMTNNAQKQQHNEEAQKQQHNKEAQKHH
jgi:hypothetical protein